MGLNEVRGLLRLGQGFSGVSSIEVVRVGGGAVKRRRKKSTWKNDLG